MLTGTVTGSEYEPKAIIALISMGLHGESHMGSHENTVWVTKTHYPLNLVPKFFAKFAPKYKLFSANRQICLVRNPIDSMVSYVHFATSFSHSLTPKVPQEQSFPEDWDYCVKNVTESYRGYIMN